MSITDSNIAQPNILNSDQPDWLKSIRNESWNEYDSQPLPSRVPLLWRYTDPAKFVYNGNSTSTGSKHDIPEDILAEVKSGELAGVVYNDNGQNIEVVLNDDIKDLNLIIGDLKSISQNHPELVKDLIGTAVGKDFGKFEALNLASWTSGIFVMIPDNLVLKAPLYFLTNASDEGKLTSRSMIIAGTSSEITLIDEITGGPDKSSDGSSNINVVTEIFAGKNSSIKYLNAQNLNDGANIFHTHRVKLDDDASSLTTIASLGGKITKANYGGLILGNGCESNLEGFLYGQSRSHYDHYTAHDHHGQHGHSDMNFKVVVKDRSSSACTGRININKDAFFSEAYQENRNLMLSPKCVAESIPELEIKNDEVKCSHGATMGPPDQDHLFYLMSRGIPKDAAINLIIEGFMEDSLKRLPEVVRDRVSKYLSKKLAG